MRTAAAWRSSSKRSRASASSINTLLKPALKNEYTHNLFRHQIITYLTRKGNYHPKLRLLSGHSEEKSLAIYRDLALANVAGDYETASRTFPIR